MVRWWPGDRTLGAFLILTVLVFVSSLYAKNSGWDHLINWNLEATAERENILVEQFERGPFDFEIEGQQYVLKETFGISAISQNSALSLTLLVFVWFGVTGILAFSTFLRRYAFLFVSALFLLFINQLYLDELSLLGASSWKWASVLLMVTLLLPAYLLHAFKEESGFLYRWLIIFLCSTGVLVFFQLQESSFYLYFAGQAAIPFSIIGALFIFLVSEEIIFLVVLFITKSAGGTNNEKHFFVFSIVYLVYLGLYWADRMGLVSGSWDYLNPLVLLIVSTLVGIYTISHKQPLLDSVIKRALDIRWLFVVLAISSFSFLTLSGIRGNDAASDAMDYLILYAHLGFGIMFVLYIIVNLITPLIQGLMIYKVVYKEHNFPYITSRLAGFIFVVGFYFYAEQAPLRRAQAARLNYLGDYYAVKDPNLGRSYYEESAVFGWDNHYASMKLAEYAINDGNLNEAIYRYNRAVSRNPSPYAYVGGANAMAKVDEQTRAASFLRQGIQVFPGQAELGNNLALLLDASGAKAEALSTLEDLDNTDSWNQAVTVNRLAIGGSKDFDVTKSRNLQTLSNWQALINKGLSEGELDFSPEMLQSEMNLPMITYLINSGWGLKRDLPDTLVSVLSQQLRNRELSRNLRHSEAYNLIKSGEVNQSVPKWEQLIQSVNTYEKGFYYRQFGNIYMKLGAPLLARDAFEEAVAFGSAEAKVSYAIASMEARDWDAAIRMWEQVVLEDSSYFDLIGLSGVLRQPMIVPSFAWLYYNLPDEIRQYDVFAELPQNQIRMLWDKLFQKWSYGSKQNDLAILTDRIKQQLSDDQKEIYETYQAAMQDPSSMTFEKASKNTFEVWKVMMVLEDEKVSVEQKYELLLSAITINQYQVDLIINYAQLAIQMGLYEYAESATLRLLTLVSSERYQEIERMLFDQRQVREEQMDDWSS
jgi:Tfp pilus assembly protein PilF